MSEILDVVGSVALRITVIYLALLALLRIGGRRELAQLTPADMLLLLLLSEAVSPALTGGQDSVGAGLFGAALLIGLTWIIGTLTFRSRRFESLIDGRPIVLVRHGKLDQKQLRSLRITDQQLRTFLHEHGVVRMDQIAVAYVEPSGKVTIVKDDEAPEPRGGAPADPDDATAQLDEIKAQIGKLEQTLRRLSAHPSEVSPRRAKRFEPSA